MKKSTRALLGMVILDALLLAGAAYFVFNIKTGVVQTTVPPAEAIETITSLIGGAMGVITAILLLAFFIHRRRGN